MAADTPAVPHAERAPGRAANTLLLDYGDTGIAASPRAVARIRAHAGELNRYPRGLRAETRSAVAAAHGVPPDHVLLTSGVDEAVDLVLLVTGQLTCVIPGFNGYWDRAEVLGVPVTRLTLDGQWDLPQNWAEDTKGALVVAQPNNPTGLYFTDETWLDVAARSCQIVMVDETYRLLADPVRPSLSGRAPENVLAFISFSKVYGLAGVRLGAMIGHPALIARLATRSRFESVDTISLHAVIGALEDAPHLDRSVRAFKKMRAQYAATLAGFPELFAAVRATNCTFVLCQATGPLPAGQLVQALQDHGVRISDCAAFGLPGWVRIGVGDSSALAALTEILVLVKDLLW